MIIVFAVIMVLLFFVGAWLTAKLDYDSEWFGMLLSVLAVLAFIACIISIFVLSFKLSELRVIDDKIAMYEEENTKIETQIADTVKQYQEYESGIFTEIAPDSAVTLVALYPELKSDTLVQKQLEVYMANNEEIKSLKETRINGSVYKWWIYFGG